MSLEVGAIGKEKRSTFTSSLTGVDSALFSALWYLYLDSYNSMCFYLISKAISFKGIASNSSQSSRIEQTF